MKRYFVKYYMVAAMAQLYLSPPEPFNFRNPEEWLNWKCRFEQFHTASGLAQEDEKRQVSTLLHCLGKNHKPYWTRQEYQARRL